MNPISEDMERLGVYWVPEPVFEQLLELQAAGIRAEMRVEESGGVKKYHLLAPSMQADLARATLMRKGQADRREMQRAKRLQLSQRQKEETGGRWMNFGKLLFAMGLLTVMGAYFTDWAVFAPASWALFALAGSTTLYGYLKSVR